MSQVAIQQPSSASRSTGKLIVIKSTDAIGVVQRPEEITQWWYHLAVTPSVLAYHLHNYRGFHVQADFVDDHYIVSAAPVTHNKELNIFINEPLIPKHVRHTKDSALECMYDKLVAEGQKISQETGLPFKPRSMEWFKDLSNL